MTTDEFLQDQYNGEIGRRYQLAGSLSLPIAVLTVLGGGLLAMGQSLDSPFSYIEWIVLVLVVSGVVSGIMVGYFMLRFQLGHDYSYVATAKQIDDYRERLRDYYKKHSISQAGLEDDVLAYIRSEMIGSAHDNALTNDLKSAYLNNANVALAVCVALTFAAAIPYAAMKVLAADRPFAIKATLEVR